MVDISIFKSIFYGNKQKIFELNMGVEEWHGV